MSPEQLPPIPLSAEVLSRTPQDVIDLIVSLLVQVDTLQRLMVTLARVKMWAMTTSSSSTGSTSGMFGEPPLRDVKHLRKE
jgi:hypothetical protein